MRRQCAFLGPTGETCRAAPLRDGQFCWVHSTEHTQELQDARRLGGLRRKREATLSGAYDFETLTTVDGIRRLIEVAVLDTLAMENSIARSRTLAYLAQTALRTLEVGDLEKRIVALEQSVRPQRGQHSAPAFDLDANLLEAGEEESK